MWDLRNSASPLKEFVGHGKGVLGMSWSAHDPSLLLSCSKDNRNICWDVQVGLPARHATSMFTLWPSGPLAFVPATVLHGCADCRHHV
jgi:protein transport protein SEC31